MKLKNIVKISGLFIALFMLSACANKNDQTDSRTTSFESSEATTPEKQPSSNQAFNLLQPLELKQMLEDKDFFLLDVHIPEQEHIPGTDAFIDYRKLIENQDQLPKNKDAKLVVYCRSGSMSRAAAKDLVSLGYTNVYDVEGGANAFNAL